MAIPDVFLKVRMTLPLGLSTSRKKPEMPSISSPVSKSVIAIWPSMGPLLVIVAKLESECIYTLISLYLSIGNF